jgi:thioredoxin-like negative regulator of GroEL
MQASLLSADAEPAETYAEAHKAMIETGKPMVVMVGTDWCGPCQKMKKTVLPEVRRHGLLRRVAFALVNADREQSLAGKLIGKGPVPQLIMFHKTDKGWQKKKLVGGQSVETVESFIRTAGISEEAGDAATDAVEAATVSNRD